LILESRVNHGEEVATRETAIQQLGKGKTEGLSKRFSSPTQESTKGN
jgi:hypothetical protein